MFFKAVGTTEENPAYFGKYNLDDDPVDPVDVLVSKELTWLEF